MNMEWNEKDFVKLLNDLYEQTHIKEFYIICGSEEIKKQLENLDLSYTYDVIVNSNIHFMDNSENIYVIPQKELKKQALKIISEPIGYELTTYEDFMEVKFIDLL